MIESAGLLIIHDNKILLEHPTKSKQVGTFSIPKGKLEDGETHLEAAIRETFEEIGVSINNELIDPTPHLIKYINKNGKCVKKLTYFVVKLDEKIEVGELQTEEVDFADYIDIDEARFRLFWRFEEMLNYIK